MAVRVWARKQHIPIVEASRGRKLSCFAPIVGKRFLAVWTAWDFRALLDRRDLSFVWRGPAEGRPVCWLDETTLLMQAGRETVAWTAADTEAIWRAEGELLGLWNGHPILLSPQLRISVLDGKSGGARYESSLSDELAAFGVVGQFAVYESPPGRLVCLSLPECTRVWQVELTKEMDESAEIDNSPLTEIAAHPGKNACTIKRGSFTGVLEMGSGRFWWRRTLRMGGSPLISHHRVGLYFCGSLCVLEETSGAVVCERGGIAPTRWESPPILHGDWMVLVDETGHIVTIGLPDGRVVGVQRERGVGFQGCVSVDGQLLVGGGDGALWVYEPSGPETSASARGRRDKGPLVSRPLSRSARSSLAGQQDSRKKRGK